jgi:SAM-dependent methyltransferase
MTLLDLGAGTGASAAAFSDWFDVSILTIEPSAAMRDQIPRTPTIQVLEGNAGAIPLPDKAADAAWLSLVIHHIPDLEAAAREIRRVLRPVLLSSSGRASREGSTGSNWSDGSLRPPKRSTPTLRFRTHARRSRPSGFRKEALEQVQETYPGSLADFLAQVDILRRADTTMRNLGDEDFLRGKERLRRAVRHVEDYPNSEARSNWLDLLVLR